MNIRTYLFRLMIAALAAILGITSQLTFKKLDRITRNWASSVAASVNDILPFQDIYEKLFSPPKIWHRTSFDLTGAYYLPEKVVPAEFNDLARIEFTMHDFARGAPVLPSGAVFADRTYRFATVTMDGDALRFETESKGGISYRFNGTVVRADTQQDECSAGDLVGKIEKLKNSSAIAALDSTFLLFND